MVTKGMLLKRMTPRPKNCLVCGAEFMMTQRRHRLCSEKCRRWSANNAPAVLRNRALLRAQPPKMRNCVECQAEFAIRKANQMICGKVCRAKRRYRLEQLSKPPKPVKVPNEKSPWTLGLMKPKLRLCKRCGAEFMAQSRGNSVCGPKCLKNKPTPSYDRASSALARRARKEAEDELIYQEFLERERQREAAKKLESTQ